MSFLTVNGSQMCHTSSAGTLMPSGMTSTANPLDQVTSSQRIKRSCHTQQVAAIKEMMRVRAEGGNIGFVLGEALRKCYDSFFKKNLRDNRSECQVDLAQEMATEDKEQTLSLNQFVEIEGREELFEQLSTLDCSCPAYRSLVDQLHQLQPPYDAIQSLYDLPIRFHDDVIEELKSRGYDAEDVQRFFSSGIYDKVFPEGKGVSGLAKGISPLAFVFRYCSPQLAEFLALMGVDVDRIPFTTSSLENQIIILIYYDGKSKKQASAYLLNKVVSLRRADLAEEILKLGYSKADDVYCTSTFLDTHCRDKALQIAIENEDDPTIEVLLKYEAKLEGQTLLSAAAYKGHFERVSQLLESGKYSKADAEFALKRAEADIICRTMRSVTSFFYSDSRCDYEKTVLLLRGFIKN